MSVFTLKIIAVFCMICDHIRYISPILNTEETRLLGRISFPIFTFLIVEGYTHTKNLKKYLSRLGIFAIVSQIPFLIFVWGCGIVDYFEFNVIFTLLTGVLAILAYDKIDNKIFKYIFIIVLVFIAEFIKMDYGAFGILLILNFYIFREKNLIKYMNFVVLTIGHLLIGCKYNIYNIIFCIPYLVGYIVSIIPMIFYNNKIGKYKMKYFFYFFYPIHMLVIYLIYNFIH